MNAAQAMERAQAEIVLQPDDGNYLLRVWDSNLHKDWAFGPYSPGRAQEALMSARAARAAQLCEEASAA
jgi:hypothetical protein